MGRIVLAADLGGTNLRVSAVTDDGTQLSRLRLPTPKSGRRDEIVGAILSLARESCGKLGSDISPIGFGLAVPATISSNDQKIFNSPNLPELDGFDLADELSNELGFPVLLENDANAAAVGENWLGASRGVKGSICVTLGTGVGGGLIINGELLRGIDGTAGEVGHINVEPDGHPCGCGSHGCLEQYASATAIVRMAKEMLSRFPESLIADLKVITPVAVFNAGKANDKLSLEAFRCVGMYLGIALSDLINVLNPEVIVIGGGASAGWDLFIEHVRGQIKMRVFREPGERAKIVRAALGDAAGILGAARLVLGSPTVN